MLFLSSIFQAQQVQRLRPKRITYYLLYIYIYVIWRGGRWGIAIAIVCGCRDQQILLPPSPNAGSQQFAYVSESPVDGDWMQKGKQCMSYCEFAVL